MTRNTFFQAILAACAAPFALAGKSAGAAAAVSEEYLPVPSTPPPPTVTPLIKETAKGDLYAIEFGDNILSSATRARLMSSLKPLEEKHGCSFLVLDCGAKLVNPNHTREEVATYIPRNMVPIRVSYLSCSCGHVMYYINSFGPAADIRMACPNKDCQYFDVLLCVPTIMAERT